MFESLPGPGVFFFILALFCAFSICVIGAILKLCGVLLVSWLALLAAPLVVIALGLIALGFFALMGHW